MIEHGRKSLSSDKRNSVKVADMERFAEELKKENWRQKAVKTTDEKRAARAGMSVGEYQLQKAALQRMKAKSAQRAKAKSAGKPKVNDAMFIKNLMSMGFNQAQAQAALAAAKATQ